MAGPVVFFGHPHALLLWRPLLLGCGIPRVKATYLPPMHPPTGQRRTDGCTKIWKQQLSSCPRFALHKATDCPPKKFEVVWMQHTAHNLLPLHSLGLSEYFLILGPESASFVFPPFPRVPIENIRSLCTLPKAMQSGTQYVSL